MSLERRRDWGHLFDPWRPVRMLRDRLGREPTPFEAVASAFRPNHFDWAIVRLARPLRAGYYLVRPIRILRHALLSRGRTAVAAIRAEPQVSVVDARVQSRRRWEPHEAVALTFVTAIYDSGPSSVLGGRGWGIAHYLPSLINIANLGAPIVLFCAPEDVRAIEDAIAPHFRDYRVIPFKLSRFEHFETFLAWKRIYRPELEINDRNEVLCFLKSYWVQQAIADNPFGHDLFFWIDAGLTHHGLFPERVGGVELQMKHPASRYYPQNPANIFAPVLGAALASAVTRGKVFFCALPFAHGAARRASYERIVAERFGRTREQVRMDDHLVGGLFGGYREDLQVVHRLYAALLKEFIDRRTYSLEEQVFSGVNGLHPELFSLRRFSTWWFHSPGERTSRLDAEGDSFYRIFTSLAPRGEAERSFAVAPARRKRIRIFLGAEDGSAWFSCFSRRFCEDFLEPGYEVEYAVPVAQDPSNACPIYQIGDRRCLLHWNAIAFQADGSGRLRLLTTHDHPLDVFRSWNFDPELVDRVYTGQYNPLRLEQDIRAFCRERGAAGAPEAIERRWRRWIYGPRLWGLVEELRSERPTSRKADLYFRGMYEPSRSVLNHLASHTDAGDRLDIRWWHAGDKGALEPREYLRELRAHAVALSLPGVSDLCNRDIECLGLGVPLLRPVLAGELAHPLEAGVHYIGVPYERVGKADDGRAPDHAKDPRQLAHDLLAAYRRVRDDPELLHGVATRAAEYYDRHCAYPASGQLTFELLDLDSL